MTKLKIHFVCRANIYRSRLAEGYFKKLTGNKYQVSSSGVERWRHPFNYKDKWAGILAKEHGIKLSSRSHQTTSPLLNDQDIIVFVRQDVYNIAREYYKFDKNKAVIWDIKDRRDYPLFTKKKVRRNQTWDSIEHSVDKLVESLKKAEAKK